MTYQATPGQDIPADQLVSPYGVPIVAIMMTAECKASIDAHINDKGIIFYQYNGALEAINDTRRPYKDNKGRLVYVCAEGNKFNALKCTSAQQYHAKTIIGNPSTSQRSMDYQCNPARDLTPHVASVERLVSPFGKPIIGYYDKQFVTTFADFVIHENGSIDGKVNGKNEFVNSPQPIYSEKGDRLVVDSVGSVWRLAECISAKAYHHKRLRANPSVRIIKGKIVNLDPGDTCLVRFTLSPDDDDLSTDNVSVHYKKSGEIEVTHYTDEDESKIGYRFNLNDITSIIKTITSEQ